MRNLRQGVGLIGALIALLAAVYLAFYLPPLVKYGVTGNALADGRLFCTAKGQDTLNYWYTATYPDGKGGTDYDKMLNSEGSSMNEHFSRLAEAQAVSKCLSETAVNVPLLALQMFLLIGLTGVALFLGFSPKLFQ